MKTVGVLIARESWFPWGAVIRRPQARGKVLSPAHFGLLFSALVTIKLILYFWEYSANNLYPNIFLTSFWTIESAVTMANLPKEMKALR